MEPSNEILEKLYGRTKVITKIYLVCLIIGVLLSGVITFLVVGPLYVVTAIFGFIFLSWIVTLVYDYYNFFKYKILVRGGKQGYTYYEGKKALQTILIQTGIISAVATYFILRVFVW